MNQIHKKSLNPNIDKVELYNQWAETYDKYVEAHNYVGPKELTDNVINLLHKALPIPPEDPVIKIFLLFKLYDIIQNFYIFYIVKIIKCKIR